MLCTYSHLTLLTTLFTRLIFKLLGFPAYLQNLMRHLKFVEDESQQMAYDDQKLSLTQFKSELERYVIEMSIFLS